ncbi:hypothetical protein JW824_09940 [bacterium]|nr:hypothetical protein [bacterium]RQV94406.1 MAG: hypothetical protein EH221_08130 [bacterium]
MAKAKTFADKVSKATHDFTTHCPKCGESIVSAKLVTSEKSTKTGAWRFNEKLVKLCKCNERETIK